MKLLTNKKYYDLVCRIEELQEINGLLVDETFRYKGANATLKANNDRLVTKNLRLTEENRNVTNQENLYVQKYQDLYKNELAENLKLRDDTEMLLEKNLALKLRIANFGGTVAKSSEVINNSSKDWKCGQDTPFSKPTLSTKVFMDVRPEGEVVCCSNCKHFNLIGVHIGFCPVMKKEKADIQRCKNKFEQKEC